LPGELTIGVGQNEESEPLLRRADLSRAEESCEHLETQSLKVAGDLVESEPEVPGDVLEEDTSRSYLGDDPPDLGPEVPRVIGSPSPSGGREGLARVARKDEIHSAAPRAAIEGLQIVPDRRAIQGRVLHPGHESGRGICVPLDEHHRAISLLGDGDAEVEPARAGAEGHAVEGV
jgi:hypothetical protein